MLPLIFGIRPNAALFCSNDFDAADWLLYEVCPCILRILLGLILIDFSSQFLDGLPVCRLRSRNRTWPGKWYILLASHIYLMISSHVTDICQRRYTGRGDLAGRRYTCQYSRACRTHNPLRSYKHLCLHLLNFHIIDLYSWSLEVSWRNEYLSPNYLLPSVTHPYVPRCHINVECWR